MTGRGNDSKGNDWKGGLDGELNRAVDWRGSGGRRCVGGVGAEGLTGNGTGVIIVSQGTGLVQYKEPRAKATWLK